MTYTKWESELKSLLAGLPEKEIEEATRYYSEIYGDKRDAGFSDEDIIKEFGTPEECAEKIRAEASEGSENNDNSSEKTVNISIKIPEKERMKNYHYFRSLPTPQRESFRRIPRACRIPL